MFDVKFKYFENNIKIVDMKYNPYAWLKTTLREYIYAVHPTTDMLWEVLECVSVFEIFNSFKSLCIDFRNRKYIH